MRDVQGTTYIVQPCPLPIPVQAPCIRIPPVKEVVSQCDEGVSVISNAECVVVKET